MTGAIRTIAVLLSFAVCATTRGADIDAVPQKWRTPFDLYLTPREAWQMKTDDPSGVVFIDVRTRAEVKYIGMARNIDANIPIRVLDSEYRWSGKRKTYRTRKNPDFVAAVDRLLTKRGLQRDAPIILMCQSGSRVPIAARALHAAGFGRVYTQFQGFEGTKASTGPHKGQRVVDGWKNAGLPWSYDLDPAKMYFNFAAKE